MKVFDKLMEIFGVYLFVMAVMIAMAGTMWQSVKPFIEKQEIQAIQTYKKLNDGQLAQD